MISCGGQHGEYVESSYLVARIHVHSLVETVKNTTVFDMVRWKGGGSPIKVMVSKRWMKRELIARHSMHLPVRRHYRH